MTAESQNTLMCNACVKQDCRDDYPKGIPDYCMAKKFHDVLKQSSTKYAAPETIDIYKAASAVVTRGDYKWSRIQEAIEFCKELRISKVGIASCVGLMQELSSVTELFTGAGFEVKSAACQVGRVSAEDRGIPELKDAQGVYCNPIAQAEIFNAEITELIFIIGLCMGHDVLFNRYSEAPVSTLIIKDRVTGHNPVAALHSSYYRRPLWKLYCNKDIN